MEISCLAALALGFIFVGSEHGEITATILQTLMEKAETEEDKSLDEKWARFMALGLGLLYLGRGLLALTDVERVADVCHRSAGCIGRYDRNAQSHRSPNIQNRSGIGRGLLLRRHWKRVEDPSDAPSL